MKIIMECERIIGLWFGLSFKVLVGIGIDYFIGFAKTQFKESE